MTSLQEVVPLDHLSIAHLGTDPYKDAAVRAQRSENPLRDVKAYTAVQVSFERMLTRTRWDPPSCYKAQRRLRALSREFWAHEWVHGEGLRRQDHSGSPYPSFFVELPTEKDIEYAKAAWETGIDEYAHASILFWKDIFDEWSRIEGLIDQLPWNRTYRDDEKSFLGDCGKTVALLSRCAMVREGFAEGGPVTGGYEGKDGIAERLAFERTGKWPSWVWHRNGDGDDYRWRNLKYRFDGD